MQRKNLVGQIVPLLLIAVALARPGDAQGQQRKFPLSKFDNTGCTSKGRVQDCSGKVMQEILAGGKNSIPILIAQLTDTGLTPEPIEDYWGFTTSGDVAYIVLTDLFLDADWKTFNMPGVPDWTAIMKGCDFDAASCWRDYVRKHGRKSIQSTWLRAWNRWKDQIYWEPTARCFRISKK